MKDRQPTQVLANGAIRYGVYNADGTLNHYEYLKREDAPTVEGTPLNKANLLSDATAAKLWPKASTRPEDPTVNDALVELQKGTSKVGDILMSVRAKPSDAWLLCNGQAITKSTYPKLFDILRPAASPAPWTSKNITGVDKSADSVVYEHSKWFAFAYENSKIHMYVSGDTNTWAHYEFGTTAVGAGNAAMCYSQEEGLYYLAISKDVYRCPVFYTISEDYQEIIEKGSGQQYPSDETVVHTRLYTANNGALFHAYWVTYGLREKRVLISYSMDGAQNWSNYDLGNRVILDADYDGALGTLYFCNRTGRGIYAVDIGEDINAATLLGTIPETIVPSGGDIWVYMCMDKETIIALYNNSGLKYAYSTDKGKTWASGAEVISTNGNDLVSRHRGFAFANGLLLLTIEMANENYAYYICSISDPAERAYKTLGSFNGALDRDGLAVNPPAAGQIKTCNYGDLAKPIPAITPDSRSHAYIKALEE